MGKYDALRDALAVSGSPCDMTFEQIANLVGGLPDSAYNHRAWWANEAHGSHVEAHAWLEGSN